MDNVARVRFRPRRYVWVEFADSLDREISCRVLRFSRPVFSSHQKLEFYEMCCDLVWFVMSSISRATAPVFPRHHKLKFALISFGSRPGLKKDPILGIELVHLKDRYGPVLFGELAIRDKTRQVFIYNTCWHLSKSMIFFTSSRIIINVSILLFMNLWPKCLHCNNKTDLVTRLTQVKQVEHLLTDEQPRS